LASRGYEQGKPTEEGVEQCKLEDKKTMGELQNQTNLASHNFSKQQYWVEEIFANLKNLPPPCSPDYIPLLQCLDKIRCICYKIFWIMPLELILRGVDCYVQEMEVIWVDFIIVFGIFIN
jgi:hypothetical protein